MSHNLEAQNKHTIKTEGSQNIKGLVLASIALSLGGLVSSAVRPSKAEASSSAVSNTENVIPLSNAYNLKFVVHVADQILGLYAQAKSNPKDIVTSAWSSVGSRSPGMKTYTFSSEEPVANGYYYTQITSNGPSEASAMRPTPDDLISAEIDAIQSNADAKTSLPVQFSSKTIGAQYFIFMGNKQGPNIYGSWLNQPKTAFVGGEILHNGPLDEVSISVVPKKYAFNNSNNYGTTFNIPQNKVEIVETDMFKGLEDVIKSAEEDKPISYGNYAPPVNVLGLGYR